MSNPQVQINVGANTAAATAALNATGQAAQQAGNQAARASQRATASTDTWQRSLARLRAQARLFGADIVGRFASAYGAMALIDKAINAVNEGMTRSAEISKASRKAGLGAEDYQRVARIAEETGGSVDEAAAAAGRYARMIRDASAGNVDAIQTLRDLGFTEAQVRRGNISAVEVLARLSAQYRNAATEADRLRIAQQAGVPKQVLEAGPAAIVSGGAVGVRTAQDVERRAAEKRMGEEGGGGFFERLGNFFMDSFRYQLSGGRGGQASATNESAMFGALPGEGQNLNPFGASKRIGEIRGQLAQEGLGEEERARLEAEMLSLFGQFAEEFRNTYQGSIQGGKVQTLDDVNAELQRKLGELLPSFKVGPPGEMPGSPAAGAAGMATAVSSMQAIGGGGGFYAGATDMVSLATRTAEATEAIAKNTEKLLGQRGGAPATPAVYISAD